MKPYKDPDELIKAEGAESYQKRINEAESGRMFELLVLYGQYNQQDPDLYMASWITPGPSDHSAAKLAGPEVPPLYQLRHCKTTK